MTKIRMIFPCRMFCAKAFSSWRSSQPGMISAIGVRNVVENRVDFTNSRNLIVAAVILVCALGFNSVGGVSFAIAGVNINLSGLAIAAIAGILLNAILPGNDYEFDATAGSDAATSGNLQV